MAEVPPELSGTRGGGRGVWIGGNCRFSHLLCEGRAQSWALGWGRLLDTVTILMPGGNRRALCWCAPTQRRPGLWGGGGGRVVPKGGDAGGTRVGRSEMENYSQEGGCVEGATEVRVPLRVGTRGRDKLRGTREMIKLRFIAFHFRSPLQCRVRTAVGSGTSPHPWAPRFAPVLTQWGCVSDPVP